MKMRFKMKELGKEEIVSKFLFLPMRIGREIRWLERVKYSRTLTRYGWYESEWINENV